MFRYGRSIFGKALVIIEHNNSKIAPSSLAAVTAARKLGDVTALVAGSAHKNAVDEASKIAGISGVISVEGSEYINGLPENVASLIKAIQDSKKFTHIVAAHTAFGKSVIPRAAALLDVQPLPDVIEIKDESTFVRPTYAGNALATVKSTKDNVKLLSVRPTNFDKAPSGSAQAKTETFGATGDAGTSRWISDEVDTSGRPDLTAARVVISGGRGLKAAENFKLLWDLADKIPNAAVGATRAVVDAGFVPNDLQIGQTGKVVAPELYIAVGLSGAIQHLAGMKDSKVIACINTDPEAPIFSISDYGLEGDLFDAIPKFKALL